MAGTEMDRTTWQRPLDALKLTYLRLREKNLTFWVEELREMIGRCQLGMEVEANDRLGQS